MGADYTTLTGDDWTEAFLPIFTLYCLDTVPAPMWGISVLADDIIILKRSTQIARFTQRSDLKWLVTLPDLGIADWTKHQ
jgi:hypothetical protein